MATHDYVIANGTGAAVRSDLNNALAAIVSNNSGSSEPGTTYAYQWWADTNANVLKIRNSSNDAWITLRELDGTMLIEDGSASTPGLAFADDVNTGIFSGDADEIGFATGGAERLKISTSEAVFNDVSNDVDFRVESNGQTHMLFVDAGNDRFGIRTSSPDAALAVNGGNDNTIGTFTSTDAGAFISFSDPTGEGIIGQSGAELRISVDPGASVANSAIVFQTDGNDEKARIDSSGRLLVGASSAIFDNTNAKVQVAADGGGTLAIGRSDTSVSNGNGIGLIRFYGNDDDGYQECARIAATADGTHADDDKPTRLEFHTTADGGSSPTEQLRINSNGDVLFKQEAGSSYPQQKLKWSNDNSTSNGFYISQNSDRNGVIFHEQGLDILFGTSNTERMRLDSSGRLMLGTTTEGESSADDLTIATSGDTGISIRSGTSSSGRLFFSDGTSSADEYRGFVSYAHSVNALQFGTDATERVRITSSGKLLLGTSSATGGTSEGDFVVEFAGNSDNAIKTRDTDNTGTVNHMVFISGSAVVGSITGTTGAASFNNLSDYRKKENDVEIADGIQKLKLLRPIRFNYIDNPNTVCDGFFAHEVTPAVPTAVTGAKDAVDSEGEIDPQMLDASKLVPLLTAALQEAIAKIETLETKVAALEAG